MGKNSKDVTNGKIKESDNISTNDKITDNSTANNNHINNDDTNNHIAKNSYTNDNDLINSNNEKSKPDDPSEQGYSEATSIPDKKNTINKSKKQGKIGTILIILGLIFFFGAGSLWLYNILQDQNAGKKAGDMCDKLVDAVSESEQSYDSYIDPKYLGTGEMPTMDVDGYKYIGTVEIPELKVKLPVQDHWDDELAKISPCRYKGSAYDGDLIIAGHNYKTHFRGLKTLDIGAEVIFTDIDSHEFHYSISDIEIMEMHEVERMEKGDWDLTLFTCTWGGKYRIAIRCKLS